MDVPIKEVSGLTRQRKVVFQVISEAHEHLTANEVFEAAKKLLPPISFATVYNSLKYLKDEGLISEVQFGSAASRFDKKTYRHDHAMCTKCGTLVDLELPVPEDIVKKAAILSAFKPESLQFTLRGLCPECQND